LNCIPEGQRPLEDSPVSGRGGRARLWAAVLLAAAAGCAAPQPPLSPEEEKVLRPVEAASPTVVDYVESGDRLFRRGVAPWRASDPQAGVPDAGRIAEAVDYYQRARLFYLKAQVEYGGLEPVPRAILDRVKECVVRISVLEKRRHAAARGG